MHLHQLTYFVAAARTQHFTRASEELGTSQPNLSKQIRALENSVGAPLFVRTSAGVALTSAGTALLPHAERIVVEVESAERSVQEVADLRRGRVRLGATPAMCEGLVPDALRAFRARHPRIELDVHEGGSRLLTRDLSDGRLDVALLISPVRANTADLVTTPALRERLVVAGPSDSDLPSYIRISDLRGLPLVMFREGYDLREVIQRACGEAGFLPTIALEGGEMGGVLRFVEAGLGFAVVPAMVIPSRPGLRAATIGGHDGEPLLQRTIAVAHRDRDTLPPSVRVFIDELHTYIAGIDSPDLSRV